jgi:CBS domain containing-hemolysin-like protein
MLVVPGEDAVQAVEEVLLLVKAVRLARVNDELGLDAVALQAAVEFLALAERIDQVGISLENQGRRFHILEMDEGRAV